MEQYPQKISSLYAAVSDFESELIVHQAKLLATTCNPEMQAPERFNAQNAAINCLTEGNSGGVTELSREVHYVICEKSQAETGAANRKLLKQGDVLEAGSEEQYVGSEKPQAETQCGELEQAKQAEVEAGFSSSATGHGDAADEQAAAGTSISRLPPPSPSTSSPPQRSCSPAVPDSLTTEADISGVTVSFLRIFVQEHELRLKDMTTAEVCSELIKAETDSERISYVELLRRTGKGAYVGDAIRFISHAWACKFLALVETIFEECEKEGLDESKCPVWLDIFTVNQHSGIEDFDHWTTSFQLAIRKIGKAWIIFVPYLPVWLTRAWCLFELYAIVEGGLQFEILLPWSEEEKFTHFLKGGGKVEDAISQIDVRKAEAFKQSDQDNINRIVAASMGHGKLNELVTTEMRKWFVSSAELAMAKMQQDEKLTSELHLNTIKMYITLGRLADADSELENRRQTQLALLGAESLKVAETMCELGTVKWKLGQLEVALSVEEEARLIYEKAAAEDLELLGNITNRIGLVLADQGKYELAMQSYTESLAIKTQWYGPEHVAVATTEKNIAIVLAQQGDLENALVRFKRALEVEENCLGSGHVAVADTQNNIANVLYKQGKFDEALKMHEMVLRIRREALGPSHVAVADTQNNIALVLEQQGKFDEALVMYNTALKTTIGAVGEDHVDVAKTEENIGNVLFQKGEYENALLRYQKTLKIKEQCLGLGHADVAGTKLNIGLVHEQLGDLARAWSFMKEAHTIFVRSLGPDHCRTQNAARSLERLHGGPAVAPPNIGQAVASPYGGQGQAVAPPYGRPAVARPYVGPGPAVARPYGGPGPAVARPYGGPGPAVTRPHGGPGPAVARPYGGPGPAVARPYGGPGPAVARPYGGPGPAVARPYGGPGQAVAPPYGGPTMASPYSASHSGQAAGAPYGAGASTRTVALGQDAAGLPGVAGLTHAEFRAGEPVAVLRTSGRRTVGRVTAAWPGWVRVEVEQGGASKDVREGDVCRLLGGLRLS